MSSSCDHDMPYPPPFYISDQGFNSDPFDDISNGPMEMEKEGFAVREWRQNAIQLEEKEKIEKEFLNQIINEADEYKVEFYINRQASLETNKAAFREKEKVFLTSHEKFHSETDKHFWKAIAELIPNEAPVLEKKKANKDEENKKPIIAVIQGPKPGKPTDLSRMRQIFLKLKHNTPAHLNTSPPELNSTNVCTT